MPAVRKSFARVPFFKNSFARVPIDPTLCTGAQKGTRAKEFRTRAKSLHMFWPLWGGGAGGGRRKHAQTFARVPFGEARATGIAGPPAQSPPLPAHPPANPFHVGLLFTGARSLRIPDLFSVNTFSRVPDARNLPNNPFLGCPIGGLLSGALRLSQHRPFHGCLKGTRAKGSSLCTGA